MPRPLLERVHQLTPGYSRLGLSFSSISLLGGFVFDAVTLKRVDMLWENFWVLVHLVAVALCILWINRAVNPIAGAERSLTRLDSWLINILQFIFGGLLSTFMVFYFRSGTFWVSWPFYFVLTGAFVANEKLKSRYARLDFQLSFFFLSLFCFMIFILPVVLHAIGRVVFILSGLVSLALWWWFVRLLRRRAKQTFDDRRFTVFASTAAIFILVNVLYFVNAIPPLPLSLQDAGIGRSITRTENGTYLMQSEKQGWLAFFRRAPRIHTESGAPVYFYSAVFSPTSLNTEIVHEWQWYENGRGWVTADRILLAVRGGRDGGYRTYSKKSGIWPAPWRVNVETRTGAILGVYRFNVLPASATPVPLETDSKN